MVGTTVETTNASRRQVLKIPTLALVNM